MKLHLAAKIFENLCKWQNLSSNWTGWDQLHK